MGGTLRWRDACSEVPPEALVSRVEASATGRAPACERTMKLPLPVKAMRARESRAIREKLDCT